MAESSKTVEQRVDKLEADGAEMRGAIVQMTRIIVELSERTDSNTRRLWQEIQSTRTELSERIDHLTERMDGVNDRIDGLTERMDGLTERMDGVNERLDRLIAVTMRERTGGSERLVAIEERLAKLEAHVGI